MEKNVAMVIGMLFVFASCVKDKYTVLEAWLYNTTNHAILILPYNNGNVSGGDTVRLLPNDSMQFGLSTELGDVNAPGFYSDYINFETNPVLVIYDDSIVMTHYNRVIDSSKKHYGFESLRNILNPKSYSFSRSKGEKGIYTNMHKYYFTEQDYLDAKD